jgi:hypothetical protein
VSDPWFYERTEVGWEIRDENRLLVAVVPDAQHEREEDARRIVGQWSAGQKVQADAEHVEEPIAAERQPERARPRVRLVGTDGNAFAVLGRALSALRDAGWSKAERDAFAAEATSGDYDQLLGTIMKHLDVE